MTTNSSAAVACAASSVIGDARELLDCEFQLLAGKRPAGFLAGVVVCPTSYSGNYPGNIQGGVVCPTYCRLGLHDWAPLEKDHLRRR